MIAGRNDKDFAKGTLSSLSTIIYVGKAVTSFKDRLKAHYTEPLFKKALETFGKQLWFSYLIVDKEFLNMLNIYEQNLIDVFGPPLNQINSKVIRKPAVRGRAP